MSTKSDAQSIGAGERIYLHIYDYETKVVFVLFNGKLTSQNLQELMPL